MFIMEPKKEELEDIKDFKLPIKEKVDILLQNYEVGMFVEVLKSTKFGIIDEFASRLILYYEKNNSNDQDFVFTIEPGPKVVYQLRKYLEKHKKFVFDYTISQEHFINSLIYQLYLEYIPYELTEVEKSVFLDAYINMVTDIKGDQISNEKRRQLEKRLSINQD